ncbi:MAG: hypothetical protein J6386_07000 [Candidatus Synoicihabitans palmerolidicus]|nr:hypothetical protein [Candidatus Synoicihabitans palmerolidicus]
MGHALNSDEIDGDEIEARHAVTALYEIVLTERGGAQAGSPAGDARRF